MESIIFRIMNLNELHKLEEDIEKMSDPQEREARTRLIEQIVERITDYDVHVREYAYHQAIQAIQVALVQFRIALCCSRRPSPHSL